MIRPSRRFQLRLIDASQPSDGIAPLLLSQLAIEPAEQVNRRVIPAPPEVVRDS